MNVQGNMNYVSYKGLQQFKDEINPETGNKFKSGKDYQGVTVEYLRSPSGTDSWHHRNGYQHAPKAIEAFIHSKNFGQVARLTHLFK
mgnify:CR=1 FL=1